MSEPKWLQLARKEVGTKEIPGGRSNPVVSKYYADAVGASKPDSVPWCAAFVGAMLQRAGVRPSGSLLARSYMNWGKKLSTPVPGCIAVFQRGSGGLVGFYVSGTGSKITLLGGNQNDMVSIGTRSNAGLIGYRWPSTYRMEMEKESWYRRTINKIKSFMGC